MAMTKEEKIKKIYEIVADKELSFWCRVKRVNENLIISKGNCRDYCVYDTKEHAQRIYDTVWLKNRIIWHPVMIWDVLDWLWTWWDNRLYNAVNIWNITDCWNHKREPIECQSDECISFIFSLIDKWE